MICFTIALMNKAVAKDWSVVEMNFNNTLHSIFNQTNNQFRVYVGYTDMPKLYEKYDQRLIMIPCNTPTPVKRIEKLQDRGWKLAVCANAIYNDYEELSSGDKGIFVFTVDADDLVNRRIVEYANNHSRANGFKSHKAYMHVKGRKYLQITPYFGGTMNVMKLFKDDLIKKMPDISLCFDLATSRILNKCPIRWTDIEVENKFSEIGRPMSYFPFRSTIYLVGTGDNLSDSDPANQPREKKKRFHPVAFLRRVNPFDKRIITNRIKQEFGIQESGFNC